MSQEYNGRERKVCIECSESIENFVKSTDSVVEEVMEQLKGLGMANVTKSFETVVNNWEALKASNLQVKKLDDKMAEEFVGTYQVFGIEEV